MKLKTVVLLTFFLISNHMINGEDNVVLEDILPCEFCQIDENRNDEFINDGQIDYMNIPLDLDTVKCKIDKRFLSFTIDIIEMKRRFRCVPLHSIKFNKLARAISPAYMRVGGTPQDFLTLNNQGYSANFQSKLSCLPKFENWRQIKRFNLSYKYFNDVAEFAERNNLKLVFGLNGRKVKGNFRDNLEIIDHAIKNKYNIEWQLGNEPNRYRKYGKGETVKGKDLAEYFKVLKAFDNSVELTGPDISHPRNRTLEYLKEFLEGSPKVKAVTYHHYFMHESASTSDDYLNPMYLDELGKQMLAIRQTVDNIDKNMKLWLGESGSSSGGGARNLSDSFIAGFFYIGSLGLASKNCHEVLIRQSFYGGFYGMLDPITHNPLPDYWTTYLFKKLVGDRFLKSFELNDGYTRFYAYCNKDNEFDITLSYINLQDKNIYVSFDDYKLDKVELYILTGENNNLLSKKTMLNNNILDFLGGNFPKTDGLETEQPFIIPKQSYGFIVIKNTSSLACSR